jgi:deoxyadenosine/deoxycytidine kinase
MYIYDIKLKFTPENRLNINRELLEMLFIIDKKMDNMDKSVVTLKIKIKDLIDSLSELNKDLSKKEQAEFKNFKNNFIDRLLEFRKSFMKYNNMEITVEELDLWLKKQAKMEAVYNKQKSN